MSLPGTRLLLVLVAAVAWSAPTSRLSAEEPAVPRYRRVYVPANQLEELGIGYRLMRRDEFEQRIRSWEEQAKSSAKTARIVRGEYRATFTADGPQGGPRDGLLNGKGAWTLVKQAEPPSTDLVLGQVGIPLVNPMWRETPSRVAMVGAQPDGQFGLRVDRGGVVEFGWSLRSSRRNGQRYEFQVLLPAAVENHAELVLPASMQMRASVGLCQMLPPDDPASLMRRWSWDFPGVSEATIAVESTDGRASMAAQPFLSFDADYDVRESGVDIRFDARIDVPFEAIQGLKLEATSPVQLLSITVDDRAVEWQHRGDEDSGQQHFEIDCEEPLQGANHRLRIHAMAPTQADCDWILPAFVLPDLRWQEGAALVTVSPPLSLRHARVDQGQHAVTVPQAGAGVEQVQARFFAADAAIHLELAESAPRLNATVGTTLRVNASTVAASVVADLTGVQGRRFDVDADIHEGWWIDAVEVEPAELLDTFDLASTENPQVRRLRIQLRRPVEKGRQARMVVRGHRSKPPEGTSLGIEQLRLLSLRDIHESRRLIAVHSVPSLSPEISGDLSVKRLDEDDLTTSEQSLIDAESAALIFDDDAAAGRLRMQFRAGTPAYAAQVSMTVAVDAQTVQENYHVRCRPESSQIERLLVHGSVARTQPIVWSLKGSANRAVTSRKLSQSEQRAVGIGEGDVWEITLNAPAGVEFELVGERSIPLTDRFPLALLSLPEAATQSGTLLVQSTNPRTHLETGMLQSIPAAISGSAPLQVLGSYRYQPAHGGRAELLREDAWSASRTAWIWSLDLQTRVGDQGMLMQRARLRMENVRGDVVEARLPTGAVFHRLIVQGQASRTNNAAAGVVDIPLPAGERYVTAEIEYTVAAKGVMNSWQVPYLPPQFQLPVLSRDWRVELSPGWELVDAAAAAWYERLIAMLRPRTAVLAGAADLRKQSDPATEALLESVVNDLKSEWSSGSDDEALTWGAMLAGVQNVVAPSATRVQVDVRCLALAGITPSTVIIARPSELRVERLQAEIVRRGFRFLSEPGLVRLTANDDFAEAASRANSDGATPSTRSAGSQSGRSHAVELMATRGAVLESLDRWLERSQWWESPWSQDVAPRCEDEPGWRSWPVLPQRSDTGVLCVESVVQRQIWAWAGLIAMFGAAWWLRKKSLRGVGVLACLLAGCTQFVPWGWLPLASGAFLGSLLVVLFSMRYQTAKAPTPGMHVAMNQAMLLALLGLAFFAARQAMAQSQPAEYRVLIPTGEDGEVEGDYVYVPAGFDRELRKHGELQSRGPAYSLHTARYQGSFQTNDLQQGLDFYEFDATFGFEVRDPSVPVSIPMGNQRLHLLPGKSTLDGEPIELEWDESGSHLIVPVGKAGPHQLELRLRPTPRVVQDQLRLELAIPRLPSSRLELRCPREANRIQVPSSRGMVERGEDSIVADLGPCDQFVVEWPADLGQEPFLAIEELHLLRVAPRDTRLQTRLRLTTSAPGQVKSLALEIDPRLRLLPLGPEQPVRGIRSATDDPQKLFLDLKLADNSEQIELIFELADTSGVGHVYFPHVRVMNGNPFRRLAAVVVDSPLTVARMENAPPPENPRVFETRWGGESPATDLVYRLPATPSMWHLETRLPDVDIAVDEELRVSVAQQTVQIHWTAAIETLAGELYQAVVQCPPQLEIADLSIVEQGRTVPVAWSRDRDGTLFVRPGRQFAKSFALELRGEMPAPTGSDWEVPQLRTESARSDSQTLSIFRRGDVMLEMGETAGYNPQPDLPLGEFVEGWGRLAFRAESHADRRATASSPPTSDFQSDEKQETSSESPTVPEPGRKTESSRETGQLAGTAGPPRSVRLRVSPNRPYAAARTITTMDRRAGGWHPQVDYRLRVRDGVVDAFRLEVPAEWSGPFEITPAVAYELLDIPGQTRRHLVIRPPVAISGEFQVRIASPLAFSDDDPDGVPEIGALDVDKLERFVVLPVLERQQRLSWDIRGLQAAVLPDDAPTDLKSRVSIASYQVVGSTFEAVNRPVQRAAGESVAHLIQYTLDFRSDRSVAGVVAADIDPAGASRCRLALPATVNLVNVQIDGRASRVRAIGGNQWEIEFASDQLPQHLQVLFEGSSDPQGKESSALPLALPRLMDVPVKRTSIRVCGPVTDAASAGGDRGAFGLSWCENRLASLQEILRQADDVALDHSASELQDWIEPWRQRADAVPGLDSVDALARPAFVESMHAVREAISGYAERHRLSLGEASSDNQSLQPRDFLDVFSLFSRPVAAEFHADGPLEDPRKLQWTHRFDAEQNRRPWIAGLLCMLAAIVVWFGPNPTRFQASEPGMTSVAGCVAGFFWIACLSPAWIGWLCVIACLLCSLRATAESLAHTSLKS